MNIIISFCRISKLALRSRTRAAARTFFSRRAALPLVALLAANSAAAQAPEVDAGAAAAPPQNEQVGDSAQKPAARSPSERQEQAPDGADSRKPASAPNSGGAQEPAPNSDAPNTDEQAPNGGDVRGPASEAPAAAVENQTAPEQTQPVDVVAKSHSRSEQLRRSARAVTVVDLEEARRTSTDLGELLARTQGVSVQRTGGLGSEQRFSLQGLENEQIRFFLDGVPLALAGYPFGIGDIPVNLIDRIELYSGVVPIRFGADALGGAVQLVTRPPQPGTHGTASLQAGSFDTVRATLSGSHYNPSSGFLAQVSTFGDRTENNYRVTVDVPDAMGRTKPTKVHLFHGGYRAAGINLLTGVTGRSWADRLLARAFTTAFERELPSDPTMTSPYGAATQDEWVAGGTLRYEHALTDALRVDAIGGYSFARRHLLDVTECIYDWFGRCTSERKMPGELATSARDAIYDTHGAFLRANAQWQLDQHQHIALTLAPTYADRTGDERRPNRADQPDLLNSERRLLTFVAGLEHHLQLLDKRFESEIFAKEYSQIARSDELLRSGERIPRDRDTHRAGAGAALRYAFIPELWAKASYEYATRLPTLDEVYGDGVLIEQNLQLAPEVSHNGNLSLASAADAANGGGYKVEVTGFMRSVDELIQLLSAASLTQRYANVASARSIGVQAAGSWTSPGGYVWLSANTTYQDFRNRSRTAPGATFYGDRIPNRPYFFATGQARLQLKGLATPRDRIMLTWTTRYTHAFFRTWESLGRQNTASTVPEQLVHALSLNYLVAADSGTSISAGIDIQNLTDARVFDAYGAERPGRAAYFKITAEH